MKNSATKRITVGSGTEKYPLIFATIERLASTIQSEIDSHGDLFCLIDEKVDVLYGKRIISSLKHLKRRTHRIIVSRGELAKSAKHLLKLIDQMLENEIDRSALIIAIGGGVTTDLAGFAASVCLRGIRWIAVPTTSLGMVDAAIGGKTGINARQGKNLIGAFWAPQFVFIDTKFALTQKKSEFADGLAEALKYQAIKKTPPLGAIQRTLALFPKLDAEEFERLVRACARVKAQVVTRDERESGERATLNFGHTIGHALEKCATYGRLSHGRAVAAGMVGAYWLSVKVGMIETKSSRTILELARRLAGGGGKLVLNSSEVFQALKSDKKRTGGKVRFVLLQQLGKAFLTDELTPQEIRQAIKLSMAALNGETS